MPTTKPVTPAIRLRGQRSVASVRQLIADESGQDLIEYALVASLVALAAIASLKAVGTKVAALFTSIGTGLTSAS